MESRPKLLMPSIVDPATHHGGAGAVTRGLLSLLEREPLNAKIECISPPKRTVWSHRTRQLTSLAKSVGSPLPAKALFTRSRDFLDEIDRSLNDSGFDLVVLNGSDLLWLLPMLPRDIPKLLIAHNIEYELFDSQIASIRFGSTLWQELLGKDSQKLRHFELGGIQEVGNVVFLSSQDSDAVRSQCASIVDIVVPPLFDHRIAERPRDRKVATEVNIGFFANFEWWPNREALHWFLTRVFPQVDQETTLHLFGQYSRDVAPKNSRLKAHGFLPELEDATKVVDFMICPVRSGGGVSVKFAECVYNRIPVLATNFAARGLPQISEPGVVLLDTEEDWIEFLRSPDSRNFAGKEISRSSAQAFSVDSHVERVQVFIQKLLDQGATRGAAGGSKE